MLISAAQIHDGRKWLPPYTVIEIDDAGTISAIHPPGYGSDVVFYEGVLCPGFVNAHCHLELSHMKGVIPEHTMLVPFLQQVVGRRNGFDEEQKKEARHKAYRELLDNGVVAVGDIGNSADTLDIRAEDQMHMHTFVECLGFTQEQARQRFEFSRQVYEQYNAQPTGKKIIRQSIVPHAPYSVSENLFRLIDAEQPRSVISIHNQETACENEYYRSKEGDMKQLFGSLGMDDSFFVPSGKSSLQTYLPYFTAGHQLLLVHNTCSTEEDIHFVKEQHPDTYWCLCPNANLYIENRLPDVLLFIREQVNICVGTDSLSSNHQLSVLEELKTIRAHFPDVSWEQLLCWGTYNGACALQMEETIGSLGPGKTPGILLISDFSQVKRLF